MGVYYIEKGNPPTLSVEGKGMRYLIWALALIGLALLLLVSGCKKKSTATGTSEVGGGTTTAAAPELNKDEKKIKERLERPLFKRPDYEPPPTYAGKCANCGQQSDKLTQIDPFVKDVGGACSEKCLNEWLEKHRNDTSGTPGGTK